MQLPLGRCPKYFQKSGYGCYVGVAWCGHDGIACGYDGRSRCWEWVRGKHDELYCSSWCVRTPYLLAHARNVNNISSRTYGAEEHLDGDGIAVSRAGRPKREPNFRVFKCIFWERLRFCADCVRIFSFNLQQTSSIPFGTSEESSTRMWKPRTALACLSGAIDRS